MAVTKYRSEVPPTGETFEFSRSARSTEDQKFRFVWTLAPKKRGPGEHYHEGVAETFEIVSGTLRIWIDGVPRDYRAGESVTVAPGVRHKFLNPGETPVVVNVALDGTRMEDTLVPIAVATYGRKPRLGEILRMLVTIADRMPSMPTSRVERALFSAVFWTLKTVGVRPYEPAHGWDEVMVHAAETPRAA